MSLGIDEGVTKRPGDWAKLVTKNHKSKEKLTFEEFKTKFLKGGKMAGKSYAIGHMNDDQIKFIWDKSGLAKVDKTKTNIKHDKGVFKKRIIKIKRNNKVYTRTILPKWDKKTNSALILASKQNARSLKYRDYVKRIMDSTGRTRQAVVKKIQRTRKAQKGGKKWVLKLNCLGTLIVLLVNF